MASHTLTLGALLGLIVSGVSAYTAHRDYVTNGEGSLQLDSEQIRRDARVGADYALELQRKCLAQEPRYVCDQKSYEELYRGQYRELVQNHKYEYAKASTNRQHRNQWLLLFGICGVIFACKVSAPIRKKEP